MKVKSKKNLKNKVEKKVVLPKNFGKMSFETGKQFIEDKFFAR